MVYGTPKLLAIYNKRYYMSTLRAPYEHPMSTLCTLLLLAKIIYAEAKIAIILLHENQ